jgi:hypothetical protein
MKLSAKKKGQIYDLVYHTISNLRRDLRMNFLPEDFPLRNNVDFLIGQVEIPLAQAIMKLLEGKSKE